MGGGAQRQTFPTSQRDVCRETPGCLKPPKGFAAKCQALPTVLRWISRVPKVLVQRVAGTPLADAEIAPDPSWFGSTAISGGAGEETVRVYPAKKALRTRMSAKGSMFHGLFHG